MWEALRPRMKPLDACRVESRETGSGIPDVNYVAGWMELKAADRWPPRGGPLRVYHFTPEQRNWLSRREWAGGKAFLMLKVGKSEWLLFAGRVAAACLGDSTQAQLYEAAIARWTRLPRTEELKKCLL